MLEEPVPAGASKWASQVLGPGSEKLSCCALLPQCPKETVVVVAAASYPRKLQGSKRCALGRSSQLSTPEQWVAKLAQDARAGRHANALGRGP